MTILNTALPNGLNPQQEELLKAAADLKLQVTESFEAKCYADAEFYLRKILEIKKEVYGLEHPEVANSLNFLAMFLCAIERYEDGEMYFLECLEIMEKNGDASQDETASVLYWLARAYVDMARYTDAEPLYKRALKIRENLLGPEHEEIADALISLAEVYDNMERYADAALCYQRALIIKEKIHGVDQEEVADILDSLAGTYEDMEQYSDAEPLFKRVLAIRENILGPDHEEVANTLFFLAGVYADMERHTDALPCYQRVLTIKEKIYGLENEKVADLLFLLAFQYYCVKQFNDAEPLFQRELSICEKIYGSEHQRVATTLLLLAIIYLATQQYTDAVFFYQRHLAIMEKLHGLEHVEVANILNSLASAYVGLEQYADAEPLYQRALAIQEKIHGPEHEKVADILDGLASIYVEMKRYSDAEPLYQRVLEIREKILGAEHEDMAATLFHLGFTYYCLLQFSDAVPFFQRELAIREKIHGPVHEDVASAISLLASTFCCLQQYVEAVPLLQRELDIWEKLHGLEHEKVAEVLICIASIYVNDTIRRFSDAEPLYQRALGILEKIHGPEHTAIAEALILLANLYIKMKRYDESEIFCQRNLAMRESLHGTEHAEVASTLNSIANIYVEMERYLDAEQYFQKALIICEKNHGAEHEAVAANLESLANLYEEMERITDAELSLKKAMIIREATQGTAHIDVLMSYSSTIGFYIRTGYYKKAELLSKRTHTFADLNTSSAKYVKKSPKNDMLEAMKDSFIRPQLLKIMPGFKALMDGRYSELQHHFSRTPYFGQHPSLAIASGDYAGALKLCLDVLGNYDITDAKVEELLQVADVFNATGNITEAELLLKRIMKAIEENFGSDSHSLIEPLNNLADIYTSTLRYLEAEAVLNRSLSLCDKWAYAESLKLESLCAMAALYAETDRHDMAHIQITRAIDLSLKLYGEDSTLTADTLEEAADIYLKCDNYNEAEECIQRCLTILNINFSSRHSGASEPLLKQAEIKHRMCQEIEAESLYQEGISLLREGLGAEHPILAEYLIKMAVFYKETSRLPTAVMLGKLAVNILQKTRHNLNNFDKKIKSSFDEKCRPTYTTLADILIESERFSEAEQVLAMLKEEQSFAFVRRDAGVSASLSSISFTPAEAELLHLFSSALHKSDAGLNNSAEPCTLGESCSNQKQSVTTSDAELQSFFDSLVGELGAAPASKVDRESDLQADLWDLPAGTVAIYAFAAEHNFRLILNTSDGRQASSYPIKDREFNRLIFDFRQALQQPVDSLDLVKELGKKLYDVILAPIEAELQTAGTHTILWMVEGLLQCMPFAALYDGSRFLVERCANVLLTPRSKSRMHDSVQPNWNALGMATTRGDDLHSPLEFAVGEISAIVRDENSTKGVLPGTKLLDDSFTWANVKETLRSGPRFQAIHIATHFHLNPVNDSQCYLLLGDGQKLSLETFRKDPDIRFQGVDVVALSACSTALSLALNNGREIDGIAGIAESKGAKSVLATLWSVEDESTSFVMQAFYRLRETGMTKGEALRLAQKALFDGDHDLHSGHNYTHPFFWAPFILIGNWK